MGNESNDIKKTLSKKNRYYIPQHQYYELRHLCLQYNDWKRAINESTDPISVRYMLHNMKLIESALKLAGDDLSEYLAMGVLDNYGYVYLRTVRDIPCCKESYYKIYRRFFYELARLKMESL